MPSFSATWRHADSSADSCWGRDMEDFLSCVSGASGVRAILSVDQRHENIAGKLMWFGSNENLQRMDRELHFQSNLSRADILERLRLDPTHGGEQLFQTLMEYPLGTFL